MTQSKTRWIVLGATALLAALPLAASAQDFGRPGFGRPGFGQPGFRRFGNGHVTWSGSVDDTTLVTVRGSDVNTRVIRGRDSGDVNSQIAGRLPDRPVRVTLAEVRGRGFIQIVQQPNPGNDFTARVRLHDPQAGSGFYHFVLAWHRDGGY